MTERGRKDAAHCGAEVGREGLPARASLQQQAETIQRQSWEQSIVHLGLTAQTRIEIGIPHIRQGLCHYGDAHGHHGTGFNQVNVLV